MDRPHGYTFIGRYDLLDRATHKKGWDWRIREVFNCFGPDISEVISVGCSVGVNEIILGIHNPRVRITGIDIDDETLRRLYGHFCPEGYFDIDFQNETLRLTRPVENVAFERGDGTMTRFPAGSFDLAMMYMLSGEACYPQSLSYVHAGSEVERIVAPNGLFWNELGLFRCSPADNGASPYRRIVNKESSYDLESTPTEREFLFPPPPREEEV